MTTKCEWYRRDGYLELEEERNNLLLLPIVPDRLQTAVGYICPAVFSWQISAELNLAVSFHHWSRRFEYPWVVKNGDFQKSHKVLDAGGCSSILPYRLAQLCESVTIVDYDSEAWANFTKTETHGRLGQNISFVAGDIGDLPFADETFDRVVCVSVLEHMDLPSLAVQELLRVLRPDGRLILTMDVTENYRYNHTVSREVAEHIASLLDLEVPESPEDLVVCTIDEHEPLPYEEKILCFSVLAISAEKRGEPER